MEDLTKLSKTELIERLIAAQEPVANTEAPELESYKIELEELKTKLDKKVIRQNKREQKLQEQILLKIQKILSS